MGSKAGWKLWWQHSRLSGLISIFHAIHFSTVSPWWGSFLAHNITTDWTAVTIEKPLFWTHNDLLQSVCNICQYEHVVPSSYLHMILWYLSNPCKKNISQNLMTRQIWWKDHIFLQISSGTNQHEYKYIHAYMQTHTHIHTYIHTYIPTCIHTYIHT